MNLDCRFQARLTDTVEIGAVSGGIRLDNYFDGHVTEGELAGARVRGLDGYAIPDRDAPHLHEIRGFALFSTAVPEYSEYNTAVVAVHGSVDMATRELEITGRDVPRV